MNHPHLLSSATHDRTLYIKHTPHNYYHREVRSTDVNVQRKRLMLLPGTLPENLKQLLRNLVWVMASPAKHNRFTSQSLKCRAQWEIVHSISLSVSRHFTKIMGISDT